jgi:arabinoxylan arabinofuranohydrolase
MQSLQKAGVIDDKTSVFRSICVNKASVNEDTQTIKQVTPNLEGVTAIKNLNPYDLQQAETMASCGGVDYEDFTNINKNTKINKLGNEVSENMQVNMKSCSWISVRGVDFGAGANKFTLRAKGTATLELRFSRAGAPIATFEFSSASEEMVDQTFDIDATKFKGVKNNLFIAVKSATDFYVDAWQFSNGESGILEVENSTPGNIVRYDLSGRRIPEGQHYNGIVIERMADGTCRKILRRQ